MTVLLTPCHLGDLARFALLRETVEHLGLPFHHVAVVHDEDVSAFQPLAGPSLDVVPSSTVLGTELDRRRQRGRQRWRRAVPAALGGGVGGWWTQQVVKLAVGERLGLDEWLCLDADAVFLRPLSESDLHSADGRLHLQEHVGLGIGRSVRDFHAVSARFVGAGEVDPDLSYVAWPVPVSGEVARRLHAHLEATHARPWVESFLDAGATEYPTYGYFARYLDGLATVVPVDKRWSVHVFDTDPAVVRDRVRAAAADPGMVLAMVHGGMHLDPASYRDVVLGGAA
ncbi:MAG: hypothetical protein JWO22_3434 [Frankiales bacterium]|nr:hypothetical protein [Frankiales bacterium]